MKKKKSRIEKSNTGILNITYLFLFIFVGMIIYFVSFQINESDEVINNSYNKREEVLVESVLRGSIKSSEGEILAQTIVDEEGNETRYYPYANMFSHSVGYSNYGNTGIELMANYKLLTSNMPVTDYALNEIKGNKNEGDNVITTLSVELTKAAYDALGEHQGAVIAIEPNTGKILTMVSKPDFDPNQIAEIYDTLVQDENNSSLLNRATSGLYTPGSTFKLFTLFEYIKENTGYNSYVYECNGQIEVNNIVLRCANGRHHGSQDLTGSFANSCNSSFANIGLTLDKNSLKKTCESLLFNKDLPLDLNHKKSQFVLDSSASEFDTMQTSIGQGKTLVTPIHLCMISSAIANGGELMKPYLITTVENQNGKVIKEYKSEKVSDLFSKSESELLKTYMKVVVTEGTATKLISDVYDAYGKTGTAQINDGSQSNSLFMGFAEQENKKIAICVVMEDMPEGSTPDVPVAKAVFDEYFN